MHPLFMTYVSVWLGKYRIKSFNMDHFEILFMFFLLLNMYASICSLYAFSLVMIKLRAMYNDVKICDGCVKKNNILFQSFINVYRV